MARAQSRPDVIRVGTAGWSIPRASAPRFPGAGSHLERYARLFSAAEINSSFHRAHTVQTYAKWAALTPPDFQFAVKCPRVITHDLQLRLDTRGRLPVQDNLSPT